MSNGDDADGDGAATVLLARYDPRGDGGWGAPREAGGVTDTLTDMEDRVAMG